MTFNASIEASTEEKPQHPKKAPGTLQIIPFPPV